MFYSFSTYDLLLPVWFISSSTIAEENIQMQLQLKADVREGFLDVGFPPCTLGNNWVMCAWLMYQLHRVIWNQAAPKSWRICHFSNVSPPEMHLWVARKICLPRRPQRIGVGCWSIVYLCMWVKKNPNNLQYLPSHNDPWLSAQLQRVSWECSLEPIVSFVEEDREIHVCIIGYR